MNREPCSTCSFKNTGIPKLQKRFFIGCWGNTTRLRSSTPISSGVMARPCGNFPCSTGWSTFRSFLRRAATTSWSSLTGPPDGRNASSAGSTHDDGRKAFSTCTPGSPTFIIPLARLSPLTTVASTNKLRSRRGGTRYSRWPELQATCLSRPPTSWTLTTCHNLSWNGHDSLLNQVDS